MTEKHPEPELHRETIAAAHGVAADRAAQLLPAVAAQAAEHFARDAF